MVLQDLEREAYYSSSLFKALDVYVVVEYTVTMLLTGEAYCIKHFVCLFDIVFSSAEKASARRIRNVPVRRNDGLKTTVWTERRRIIKDLVRYNICRPKHQSPLWTDCKRFIPFPEIAKNFLSKHAVDIEIIVNFCNRKTNNNSKSPHLRNRIRSILQQNHIVIDTITHIFGSKICRSFQQAILSTFGLIDLEICSLFCGKRLISNPIRCWRAI